ncbi:MAG: hypothetical protein KJO07_02440 [Deltaproteobacteria bacterium]|nr:hypothetical protein [Deltaproteobacteria bacterium]
MRGNLTVKHGQVLSSLRGHGLDAKTTRATADHPRILHWDEQTGFAISYWGGHPQKTAEDQNAASRIGMLAFDHQRHQFELWSLTVPTKERLAPTRPKECLDCHGPVSRPIWPMYPDWPRFVGSDNDELTQDLDHQRKEAEILGRLRVCATGKKAGCDPSKRYRALFGEAQDELLAAQFASVDNRGIRTYLGERDEGDSRRRSKKHVLTPAAAALIDGSDDQSLRRWLGLTLHPSFPYRPNHAGGIFEASRAFAHRPNSRLGILYNRLNALRLWRVIREHAAYRHGSRLFLFELMSCDWKGKDEARKAAYADVAAFGAAATSGRRLTYPELMGIVGLSIRDVDIRLSYANRRYRDFDGKAAAPVMAETAMDLGYIAYSRGDRNALGGRSLYFNSYFDGSASLDELLAAHVGADVAKVHPAYAPLLELNSMAAKYGHVTSRWQLDKSFLERMDALGRWLPLPYPGHLKPLHHRQSFNAKRRASYIALCDRLLTDVVTRRRLAPR